MKKNNLYFVPQQGSGVPAQEKTLVATLPFTTDEDSTYKDLYFSFSEIARQKGVDLVITEVENQRPVIFKLEDRLIEQVVTDGYGSIQDEIQRLTLDSCIVNLKEFQEQELDVAANTIDNAVNDSEDMELREAIARFSRRTMIRLGYMKEFDGDSALTTEELIVNISSHMVNTMFNSLDEHFTDIKETASPRTMQIDQDYFEVLNQLVTKAFKQLYL